MRDPMLDWPVCPWEEGCNSRVNPRDPDAPYCYPHKKESEIATLRAEVEREHELYLMAHRENMNGATLLMEMKARLEAAESHVEALKKERDDFKWKYENESNRIGATRLAEINALRARSVAAESEATRLKAERDEAMAAGYAQGVEATEARASKRIAELEADYERVQKLSSDAGSKGHKLLAELTRLREREKVLVEALLLGYKGVQALWEKDGVTLNGIPSLSEFHDLMDRATDWGRHPPDFAALSAENNGK